MSFDDEQDDANHAVEEMMAEAAGPHRCPACEEDCDCGEAEDECPGGCSDCLERAAEEERRAAGPQWDTWEEYRDER